MNQDPKDQKPLSDDELKQAAGGAESTESTGGGGTSAGTESTAQPEPHR
jgi:hypothetical protein